MHLPSNSPRPTGQGTPPPPSAATSNTGRGESVHESLLPPPVSPNAGRHAASDASLPASPLVVPASPRQQGGSALSPLMHDPDAAAAAPHQSPLERRQSVSNVPGPRAPGGSALSPLIHDLEAAAAAPHQSPAERRQSVGNVSGPHGGEAVIDLSGSLSVPMLGGQPPAPSSWTTAVKNRWEQASKWAPAVDFVAAGASLATSLVGGLTSSTVGAQVAGASSGALWAMGAGMAEGGNTLPESPPVTYPRLAQAVASASNALNASAGVLGAAAALTSGSNQSDLGYASAAAWGASAVTSGMNALLDNSRNRASRLLQAGSAMANAFATGMSVASVDASAKHDTVNAMWYGNASAVAWAAGAVMSAGSAYAAKRASTNPATREASQDTALRDDDASRSYGAVQIQTP
ncbi:hypothetical protein BGL_1c11180 [Burkholderia plantarii]|uniref:Uncharacterized protein n=1 Tax=Burkholderia plantarii TaxID=41899 RepID=A0A0B6RX57_BURPL|nr:hypothetical protein BGL_1c11180 [Burkholderia plantarii]